MRLGASQRLGLSLHLFAVRCTMHVMHNREQPAPPVEHSQLDVGARFFDEMARKRSESQGEVVMVIRRPRGKVLLVTKEFYPAGVYRLPSGQMEQDECPKDTLQREVLEETGLHAQIERCLCVISCILSSGPRRVEYLSYVMLTQETAGKAVARDTEEQITGFDEVDPCNLSDVAKQLRELSDPWRDWGRFRALAHDFVYRVMCDKRLSPS